MKLRSGTRRRGRGEATPGVSGGLGVDSARGCLTRGSGGQKMWEAKRNFSRLKGGISCMAARVCFEKEGADQI